MGLIGSAVWPFLDTNKHPNKQIDKQTSKVYLVVKCRLPWQTSEIQTPDRQTPEIQTTERQTPEIQTTEIQTSDRQTPERQTPEIQTPERQTSKIPLLWKTNFCNSTSCKTNLWRN